MSKFPLEFCDWCQGPTKVSAGLGAVPEMRAPKTA